MVIAGCVDSVCREGENHRDRYAPLGHANLGGDGAARQEARQTTKAAANPKVEVTASDFVVCVGYDPREVGAWHVCAHSIMKHASRPVSVMPIMLSQLDGACAPDTKASTEFSISRFLTPYLARANVSMFVDCDFLFLDDVWKLYELARSSPYADVLCVQHDYIPKNAVKFLGHEQHTYPRKNWSSLMLFNAHRSSVRMLTPARVKSLTPGQLHRMAWASAVGKLPAEWNWLVGEYADRDPRELNALHYTLGGPWFGVDSFYADLWRRELAEITGGLQ